MRIVKAVCLLVLNLATIHTVTSIARADDVTDWNQHMLRAGTVGGTSPIVMTRVAAIVQASVFDAVNGIDRKYAPIHVSPGAPTGASRRAAAVEAAYTASRRSSSPDERPLCSRLQRNQDDGQHIEYYPHIGPNALRLVLECEHGNLHLESPC